MIEGVNEWMSRCVDEGVEHFWFIVHREIGHKRAGELEKFSHQTRKQNKEVFAPNAQVGRIVLFPYLAGYKAYNSIKSIW
jgi:hypothetical protein